jgi:sodium/pantothenate symporter
MIGIGARHKNEETTEQFLISGRNRMGAVLAMSTAIGWINGEYFQFYSSNVFEYGWAPLLWVIGGNTLGFFIFLAFVPRIYRHSREQEYLTFPDFLRDQWSPRVGFATALVNVILLSSWLAIQFIVGAGLVRDTFGWSYELSVILLACATFPYTFLGGLRSVITTDALQCLIVVVGMVIIVGGLLLKGDVSLPPSATLLSMEFSSWGPLTLMIALWVCVSGDVWQRVYAAPTEKEARRGVVYSCLGYAILALGLSFIFLTSRATALAEGITKDQFLIYSLTHGIPPYLIPAIALVVIASLMSTVSTAAFASAVSLVNDFLPHPSKQAKSNISAQRVHSCRLVIASLLIGSVILAIFVKDALALLFTLMSLSLTISIPTLAALLATSPRYEPLLFYSIVVGVITWLSQLSFYSPEGWFQLLPALGSCFFLLLGVRIPSPPSSGSKK